MISWINRGLYMGKHWYWLKKNGIQELSVDTTHQDLAIYLHVHSPRFTVGNRSSNGKDPSSQWRFASEKILSLTILHKLFFSFSLTRAVSNDRCLSLFASPFFKLNAAVNREKLLWNIWRSRVYTNHIKLTELSQDVRQHCLLPRAGNLWVVTLYFEQLSFWQIRSKLLW
jgi:hypothetical protein